MISEEDKISFIFGENIAMPGGVVIRAKYECWEDWEFGPIVMFGDKLLKNNSSVVVYPSFARVPRPSGRG